MDINMDDAGVGLISSSFCSEFVASEIGEKVKH